MAGPGNILIKIGAEASQALGEFDKVNGKMGETATRSQKVGSALKSAAVPATIALGAIAVGAKKAIDAASELEKAMQRNTAVFGSSADAVESWSGGLAKSFGLSEDAALAASDKFGNLFQNLGYSTKQSAAMSEQFVQLASDMASANNVPFDETLSALQSGMSGATRGLKKYGIVIDTTALKQEALKLHLYSGKGALDAHAKAAASAALILKQTSNVAGDFAKHAGDAANQSKIQAAETANLSDELGKGLLPYYEAGEKLLVSFTDELSKHTGVVKVAIGVVAGLAAAVIIANAAFKAWAVLTRVAAAATKVWAAAQWLFNAALDANPIGIAVVAIAALTAGVILAYKHSATFRRIVAEALSAVGSAAHALAGVFTAVYHAAASAFDWIVAHWKLALFAFGPIGAGLYLIVTNFNKIKSAASSAFGVVTGAIDDLIGAVKDLIGWLGKIHVPHISLPHIPGLGHLAAAPAFAAAPSLAGYGPLARGAVPAAGGRAAITPAGITVNFYGPTDPEGAARAIARVLRNHDVRQGRTR